MSVYDHKKIEAKWRKKWEKDKTFRTPDPTFAKASVDKPVFDEKLETKNQKPKTKNQKISSPTPDSRLPTPKKFYALIEFPYPSGDGLHVGHPRPYTAMDIIARKRRMEEYHVLYPIGFDAFGLPTENYAIKTKTHPAVVTKKNIAIFTEQLKSLGFSFDWERAVDTTDPAYYKWTQWIFLQLYKHGLAYKAEIPINWCLTCKIGLANEEVVKGRCERCGGPVKKRFKSQWMLKITQYADRLLDDLETTQYLERIKTQQREWIGRKQGINITYRLEDKDGVTSEDSLARKGNLEVTVFTTRPDTNFGATFVVIGPEHPLITDPLGLGLSLATAERIEMYKKETILQKDFDRTSEDRKKTGVFTGLYSVNPLNGYRMPLYVADYVLGNVGTGAVVGVPGHDKRDFEFAKVFDIPVIRVVQKNKEDTGDIVSLDQVQEHEGTMINSGFLDGMDIHAATSAMMDHIEKKGYGKRVVSFKLRDWVFSRQRYWGEPIPLVYCEHCAKEKHKFVLLHGYNASPTNEKFFPWLARELESKGFEVIRPEINFSKGDKGAVNDLLKQGILDCDTTVIAFSLSGPLMLKLLATKKASVHQLVMVAPPIEGGPFRDGKERPEVTEFCDWKFDFEKVKKHAGHITIVSDLNDHIVPPEEPREAARKLGAYLKEGVATKSHFGGEEEQSVLNAALTCVKLNPGWIPLPEHELPLKLPDVHMYEPTDTGESPLAHLTEWIETTCPKCGGKARRETDTMPNWAGSSWYFLRYTDPENDTALASPEKLDYWTPIDWYNGGMEHTTLHLLYSRFWHKFLYDLGMVPTDEPYVKRTSHGMILGEGGIKMSKSKGNVINPNDIVEQYGADTLRLYEMFMGPFDQAIPWDNKGVDGCHRFIQRLWKTMVEKVVYPSLREGGSPKSERSEDADETEGVVRRRKIHPYNKELIPLAARNRKNMSAGKVALWSLLKGDQIAGFDFHRQKVIGNYIVDFYSPELEMVIEVDGDQHDLQSDQDAERQAFLEGLGIKVVRMSDKEAMNMVPEWLEEMCSARFQELKTPSGLRPPSQGKDENACFLGEAARRAEGVSTDDPQLTKLLHKTVKKVGEDIERMAFNTAVSSCMILLNEAQEREKLSLVFAETFVTILSSFIPFVAEELWASFGHRESISKQPWPTYDPALVQDDEITLVVQVNGKVRDSLTVPADITKEEALKAAYEREAVQKWISGKTITKEVFVPGKLVSVVVG